MGKGLQIIKQNLGWSHTELKQNGEKMLFFTEQSFYWLFLYCLYFTFEFFSVVCLGLFVFLGGYIFRRHQNNVQHSQNLHLGIPPDKGGTLTKIVRGCACRPRKSDFLYTNFVSNFPPICIPFSNKKHTILTKLGAFYNNLPKIHPIYVIWAPLSLMKTPIAIYQISQKSAPKGRHIHTYTMSMWEPPPPRYTTSEKLKAKLKKISNFLQL